MVKIPMNTSVNLGSGLFSKLPMSSDFFIEFNKLGIKCYVNKGYVEVIDFLISELIHIFVFINKMIFS